MNNKRYTRFYILSLLLVLIASAYPLYMGVVTTAEMIQKGAVSMESYPKYIIPYTPIAVAMILGVALLPLLQKLFQKTDFLWSAVLSTGIFFMVERLMETKILVQAQEVVYLESWQLSLCYIPPELYQTRTWEAVDVLLGGYSPAFKLHFYLISVVIIVTLLNCFYGFAKMIRSGDYRPKKALVIQGVTGVAFLGMCIWACFTAFYRTGEITVSARSGILMAVFFALMGITMGVFVGSFTLDKHKIWSVWLPAVTASLITLAMYIGEMLLLSGNLYRFGTGILFRGLAGIVLAPVDILIILISGIVTALTCLAIRGPKPSGK
ncbi:MAG: hypothetical protein ACI3V3_04695 [Faecousia sp.]